MLGMKLRKMELPCRVLKRDAQFVSHHDVGQAMQGDLYYERNSRTSVKDPEAKVDCAQTSSESSIKA